MSARNKILFSSLLAAAVSLPAIYSQSGGFDPSSVRPKGCGDGSYNCGYTREPHSQMRAIPISDSALVTHRGLPSKVDLSDKMPPVGNQGQQGSCVGWATTYAMKSYHERIKNNNWDFDPPWKGGQGEHIFSPAFTYNQINGGRDNGSVISDALRLLVNKGAVPWKVMPYSQNDYTTQPTSSMKRKAMGFRAKSYKRMPAGNINAIKAELAKGNPVVTGVPVDDNFYGLKKGVLDSKGGRNYGGHAILIVGYDDNKRSPRGHRGAIKIINSWGTYWGDRGYGWISYKYFLSMSPWSLVLYDADMDKPVDPSDDNEDNLKPPLRVTATRGTYPDKVVISWSASEGALAYHVERAVGGSNSYSILGYSDQLKYTDTAVQADVAYKYRVIAYNDSGNTDPADSKSVEGFARKKDSKPGKVVSLNAQLSGSGRATVKLNWQAAENASRYIVVRYAKGHSGWKTLNSSNRSTSYTDSRPVRGVMNYYAVRAKNSKGQTGAYSPTAQVNVPERSGPPARVSSVKATNGSYDDRIVISWQKAANAEFYYLYRYDYSSRSWNRPVKVNSTRYTDSGNPVNSGRYFAYLVLSANKSGYASNYSPYAYGRVSNSSKRNAFTPDAPENVGARINKMNVRLSWAKSEKAEKYNVFRKKAGQKKFKFIKAVKGLSFSEKFPGKKGELYFYTVRGATMMGESENSEIVPVFVNEKKYAASHRFMGAEGLDRFTGTWSAQYWEAGKAPRDIEIEVNAKGKKFTVQLKDKKRKSRGVSGTYAVKSNQLLTDGFEMQLSSFDEKMAVISVDNKRLFSKPFELSFNKK